MSNVKIIIGLLIGLLGYILLAKYGFAEGVIGFQTIYAVSPTTTATPAASPSNDKKILDLKERIASRVAQLNLVERRGMVGTIANISGTRITLVDLSNRTRLVETDELTQSSKVKDKMKLLASFKTGGAVSILGLYNKSSRVLLARFIEDAQLYTRIFGEVTDLDKKNFSVSINENGKTSVVDIESTTQTSAYTDGVLGKSGFSKIDLGQKVFAVAIASASDSASKNHYAAIRFIMFPNASVPTKTQTSTPIATPTAKPTGQKITPSPQQ